MAKTAHTLPKPSPIKKQFDELKAKHPDALLLFRLGDFYETYEDDATAAAGILGITLTRQNDRNIAGFPYHALDSYLPKLIRAGKRVAICDALETSEGKTEQVAKTIVTPNNNQEETDMTQEEMTKQIEDVKREAQDKILAIASETIKALNGKLPLTLNSYFAKAIGELQLIKLKNNLNAEITKAEMAYLIEWAEKGLNHGK